MEVSCKEPGAQLSPPQLSQLAILWQTLSALEAFNAGGWDKQLSLLSTFPFHLGTAQTQSGNPQSSEQPWNDSSLQSPPVLQCPGTQPCSATMWGTLIAAAANRQGETVSRQHLFFSAECQQSRRVYLTEANRTRASGSAEKSGQLGTSAGERQPREQHTCNDAQRFSAGQDPHKSARRVQHKTFRQPFYRRKPNANTHVLWHYRKGNCKTAKTETIISCDDYWAVTVLCVATEQEPLLGETVAGRCRHTFAMDISVPNTSF